MTANTGTRLPQTFPQACRRIDQLAVENVNLSEQRDELQYRVDGLLWQRDELRIMVNDRNDEITQLAADRGQLLTRLQQVLAERAQLADQVDELRCRTDELLTLLDDRNDAITKLKIKTEQAQLYRQIEELRNELGL